MILLCVLAGIVIGMAGGFSAGAMIAEREGGDDYGLGMMVIGLLGTVAGVIVGALAGAAVGLYVL